MKTQQAMIGDMIPVTLRVVTGPTAERIFQGRTNEEVTIPAGYSQVVADVPAHEYFSMGVTYRTEARVELYSAGGMEWSREAKEREASRTAPGAAVRFRSGLKGGE